MGSKLSDIVSFDGTKISYLVKEGREPALVLIHGSGSNHSMWIPYLNHFKNKIIAPDLRGHGRSGYGKMTIENCANKEPVLATVGTSKLTKKELLVQIPSGVQLSKENIDLLIDKWINTELLYQEAKRQKLEQDETLKIQLTQLKKELVVNKLLEKLTENITVSKQEVFDYFTK
ncbi:MAG: alpha/beta hydrolase, partial [Candidatus Woesearchaeota archaeon]